MKTVLTVEDMIRPSHPWSLPPAAGAKDRTVLEGIIAEAEQSFLDTFGSGALDPIAEEEVRPPRRRRNTFQTIDPQKKDDAPRVPVERIPAPRDRISKRTLEALRYWTAAGYLRYGAVRTTPAGISAQARFTQSEAVFDVARWARFYNEACMLMYRPDKKIHNLFNY